MQNLNFTIFSLVLVLILLNPLDSVSQNNYNTVYEFKEQHFDVLSYNLTWNLISPSKKLIQASVDITVYWKDYKDNQNFYFNLDGLQVDSVLWDGKITQFAPVMPNSDLHFHYEIARPNNNDSALITIYYHGEMKSEKSAMDWGGVHSDNGLVYNMGVGFYYPAVSCTRFWMPCYDHPQDKAAFQAEFIVPVGLKVASNGILIDEFDNDSTSHFIWKQDIPSATYLLNFAISNFVKITKQSDDNIPIEIYSRPDDSIPSSHFYANVGKMSDCYQFYFTPYPFDKIGYVNTTLGAMEHQTMISMSRDMVVNSGNGADIFSTTAAHELAHSWFGNLVSPKDFRDVWFNESFATFCEAFWKEYQVDNHLNDSKTDFHNKIYQDWSSYNSIINQEGLLPLYNFKEYDEDTELIEPNISNYPFTIYYKGSVVLQLLMYELGRDVFLGAVNNILAKYAYSNINTAEIKKEFEEYSGQNLDNFFDQWIYQPGFPILNIKYQINNGKVIINVTQKQKQTSHGKYSKILLPLNFVSGTSNDIKYYYISDSLQTIEQDYENTNNLDYISVNSRLGWISPINFTISKITDVAEHTYSLPYTILSNSNSSMIIQFFASKLASHIHLYDIIGNQIDINKIISISENQIIINKEILSNGYYILNIIDQKSISIPIIISK